MEQLSNLKIESFDIPEEVNEELYSLLMMSPHLLLPVDLSLEDKCKIMRHVVTYYISGKNEERFNFLFGRNPSVIQPAEEGRPCGHIFTKGEGIYRCQYISILLLTYIQ